MKIFAYGALMSLRHMREHAIPFHSRIPATLEGFELTFEKKDLVHPKIGWANIRRNAKENVHGILYDIPEDGVVIIDIREEYPTGYTREPIEALLQSGEKVQATAYVAHPTMVLEDLLPTSEYINLLCEAIEYLPAAYINSIRKVQSLNIELAYLRS